jgi:hypothetical protein
MQKYALHVVVHVPMIMLSFMFMGMKKFLTSKALLWMSMKMIMDVFTIVVMVTSITTYDHVDYGGGAIFCCYQNYVYSKSYCSCW